MKRSIGLGDTIEKITTKTGIKAAVHLLFGPDCGCEKRKEKLNKLFPYKTECLTEQEYTYLKNFDWATNSIDYKTQTELLRIYNRVFNTRKDTTNCAPCLKTTISELKLLYEQYKIEASVV